MKEYFISIAMIIWSLSQLNAQTIPTPTQTDVIIIDNGTSGKADPNDLIQYKVTIQNMAGPNATGVQLNIVPDPRTTFVAGSFRSSPLALNDAYSCTGNVGINVPAASGLKFNDFDDNIAAATIAAGTFATTAGGSISIATDGGFTYTPLAGFTGADTYVYTLNDANGVGGGVPATDVATVTITVSNMIWFIDNSSVAATSDGRLTSPFKTLADFNAGSATVGDLTYIEHTGTNYIGGIVLQDNERVYGEGHTGTATPNENLSSVLPFSLAPNSKTLPNIDGSRPILTNVSGDGVTLAMNNNLRGFDVGNCADFGMDNTTTTSIGNLIVSEVSISNTTGGGFDASNGSGASMNAIFGSITSTGGVNGIDLVNCAGTFTVNGGTITNPTGTGVLISGGSVTFSSSGVITDNTGYAVDIDNHDSNNITFSGNITSTGSGIRVQNCGGGTITFSGSSKSLNTGANTSLALVDNTGSTILFTNGGLDIDATTATAFSIIGGGTVTVNGIGDTINTTSGTAFFNNGTGGSATISINSVMNTTTGIVAEIQNRVENNVTLFGNLTKTGTGTALYIHDNSNGIIDFAGSSKIFNTNTGTAVNFTTNPGTTIRFPNGGLVINTTSGIGFNATGGGGIAVIGNVNSISSVSATALNVVNTTIVSNNLNFQSISSGNNTAAADPVNGIVLNNTGTQGGLIVIGDGGGTNNNSGGTIQNTTGAGISLNSTINISLNYLNISNSGDDGISGTSVTGFNMNRSNITDNGNALNEDGVDFGGSGVITPNGLYGASTVTNSIFTGNYYNQFTVRNSNNSLNISMSNCMFNGRSAENNNNDGLFFESMGTASITASVLNSTFSANKGDHMQSAAVNSGDLNITFNSNTLTGGHTTALGQGITINAATGVPGFSGNVIYEINANNFNGAISNSISAVQGTSSNLCTFDGKITNNIIGTSGVSKSGSTQANGIYVDSRGNGKHTALVTGNIIRQCFDRGILLEAGDGNPTVHLTIQSNIIDQQVDPMAREAIQTNFGITPTNVFGDVDTPIICLQLGGAGGLANTFSHGAGAPDDFRLRKRFEATVRLPGYVGGTGQDGASLAAVVAFIQGQNTGSAGEPGSASASGTGGGYTGGAVCDTP